jgi:hypothetical protein
VTLPRAADKNPADLLSARGQDKMDRNGLLNERYRRAFKKLRKKNPLVRMADGDREHLIACLRLFEHSLDSTDVPSHIKEIEKAHDVAKEARSLAQHIQRYVFQGAVAEARSARLKQFEKLPDILIAFADQVSSLVGVLGERGQKHKASTNDLLVEASEVVKLSTGSYNDEYLRDLLQLMFPGYKDGFSGDAIRKRRKRTPPERYAAILSRVRPK